jgi:hypothetical protein
MTCNCSTCRADRWASRFGLFLVFVAIAAVVLLGWPW